MFESFWWDYLLQENGHVVAIYDMGEGQQRLVEDSRYFDDGQYHVVRFFRSNNDGTLQVDTLPIRERKPIGKKFTNKTN